MGIMNLNTSIQEIINVTCPFCGLACDDLRLKVSPDLATVKEVSGCARSVKLFHRLSSDTETRPMLNGRASSFEECVRHAAGILARSQQPLIGGLGSDVGGVRAALSLADRIGAVVDHMNTRGMMRNLLTLQDTGWIASTFAEVRNRADFVMIVGSDLVTRFPRVIERLIAKTDSPFHEKPIDRRVVCLGVPTPALPNAHVLECPTDRLAEVIGVMRALLAGTYLQAETVAGIPIGTLRDIVEKMKSAQYGVIAWAAADLDLAHGELTVQGICTLVADLNETTRFGGLPLGGNDGDVTANQVTAWQTGFPLRTSFGRGVPDYDPIHFSTERMLSNGEADALLWISALDPERYPPDSSIPKIVLGCATMKFESPPEVFIPVATPGLHHPGHYFRSDSVMAVRLRKLIDSPLPSVASTVLAIEQAL